ncbi:MAG: colicin import membrane protein [Flavobacteriales bacterium]|jgi:colicin import membrane protein
MRISLPFPVIILLSLAAHAGLLVAFSFASGDKAAPKTVKTPRYIEAKLVKLKAKTPKPSKPKKVNLTKKKKPTKKVIPNNQPVKKIPNKPKTEVKPKVDTKALEEQKEKELKRRQDELRNSMEAALAQQDTVFTEDQNALAAQSYIAAISQRIEDNWDRPPSARNGMRCELRISLVPTGRIVSVSIIKSSGNTAFDRSAEQAVQKIESIPEIAKMPADVFERDFRNLTLIFNPQDLRQ